MNHQFQIHIVLMLFSTCSSWIFKNLKTLSHKSFLKFCSKPRIKCFSKFIESTLSFGLKEKPTQDSASMLDHLMSLLITKLTYKKLFKSTITHGPLKDFSQQEPLSEHQKRLQELWKELMNCYHKQRCSSIW